MAIADPAAAHARYVRRHDKLTEIGPIEVQPHHEFGDQTIDVLVGAARAATKGEGAPLLLQVPEAFRILRRDGYL